MKCMKKLWRGVSKMFGAFLERLGYYFSTFVNYLISGFIQIVMAIGKIVVGFFTGVIVRLIEQMPSVDPQQASAAASFARNELEKWNYIFPIYEALGCLTLILYFRMVIGVYRAFCTMIWNASNMHNALPKIGGTG